MGTLTEEVRTEVLCGRICDLEAENAKLREQVDAAHMSRLLTENENESLRELVWDMYVVMVEDAANCDVTYPEQFDDRMRELGVEVDG